MASNIFPVAVTSSSSGINASAITAASAFVVYEGIQTFDPAIYTITCASATITNIQFLSNTSTLITSGVTASGTISINLASTADRIRLWTNTGSNVVVTITKTASALTNQFSGTLDTITSSTTYTQTSTSGFAYFLMGGGGGGAGSANQQYGGGSGGGSGGFRSGIVALTGSMPIVIGAFGALRSAGGSTTFAGLTCTGGGGGADGGGNATGGAGGTPDGSAGGGTPAGGSPYGSGGGGGGITSPFTFITNGTTFGIGGNGGGESTNTSAGGLSAGGGGGASSKGYTGQPGGAGVVYILRF